MINPQEYHEFFVAVAGAGAALIGLLFVAVSVFPEHAKQAQTQVTFQNRASAALLVFTNALVLALAALVPQTSLGWWAVLMSASIVIFTAATIRSILVAHQPRSQQVASFGVVAALLLIAGFEMYAGIRMLQGDQTAMSTLSYVLIADLVVGINRAWQLVGLRDTGPLASLRMLAGLRPSLDGDTDARSAG